MVIEAFMDFKPYGGEMGEGERARGSESGGYLAT